MRTKLVSLEELTLGILLTLQASPATKTKRTKRLIQIIKDEENE